MSELTEKDVHHRRLRSCVEAWPGAWSGDYDPRCCRFPKSCSPHGNFQAVLAGNLTEDDLEPDKKNHVEWDIDRNLPMSVSKQLECIECGKTIKVQIYKNSGWCSAKCMKNIARLTGFEDASPREVLSLVGPEHFVTINNARRALNMPILEVEDVHTL